MLQRLLNVLDDRVIGRLRAVEVCLKGVFLSRKPVLTTERAFRLTFFASIRSLALVDKQAFEPSICLTSLKRNLALSWRMTAAR